MRILEQGKIPSEKLWRGHCRACNTKFEACQGELTNITAADQRTETFAREICIFCGSVASVLLYPVKDDVVPDPVQDVVPASSADTALVACLQNIVLEYYAALDAREHGGAAQDRAFKKIERELGMSWHK